MKNKIKTITILLLFSLVSFAQAQENLNKTKEGYFDSQLIKAVMYDSYLQYKSDKSIDQFMYDEQADRITFADSFSKSSYQGVIELGDKTPYKYYIKSAIIYWEVYNPLGARESKYGQLDINKFYQDSGIAQAKCPPCIAWVIIVGIGAGACATITSMCNERCRNCTYGASVCNSSCFTNSCEVQCNSGPGSGPNINNPWDIYGPAIDFGGAFLITP